METINKLYNGLHLDNNRYDQPEHTMVNNYNGVIMDIGGGNYEWRNLIGAKLVLTLSSNDVIYTSFSIRERKFLIVYNDSIDRVYIYEMNFNFTLYTISLINKWTGLNSELNLSINHPVTSIFGYYESEDIQRVYWTDNYNIPRTINLESGTLTVTLEEKFLDIIPKINGYGDFKLDALELGGNCKAGTYFFAWRYYKDGYYTDWSNLTSPVHIMPGNPYTMNTALKYQRYQGAAPNENCNVKIKFWINDYDTDYESIQICAFYSNNYNSLGTGVLFFDGVLTGSGMAFYFLGNENIGTVTINDLKEISLIIKHCKDFTHIKDRAVIANITERSELDIALINGKDNEINVTMNPIIKGILLDSTGYPITLPLSGITLETGFSSSPAYKMVKGITYQAITQCVFTDGTTRTIPTGNIFELITVDTVALTSGTARVIAVKKRFRPVGATSDINTYELETYQIYNQFNNYKNPIISNNFKSYPGGETIRLGIVFYDLTGRPFFVRHLYNTTTSYGGHTIGPGDITIPKRYPGTYHTHRYYEYDAVNFCYNYVIGNIIGISISGIDITRIRNLISGFSIVRAPIERQILGYGILGHFNESSGDLTVKPRFCNFTDSTVWSKGYPFWCPEDLFELTGFSIKEGDSIVNSYYLEPYYKTEVTGSYLGVGKEENSSKNSYYQKFFVSPSSQPTTSNGAVNLGHELSAYTKYELGDDTGSGISVDPSDPTMLFKEAVPGTTYKTHATYCSILVFEELAAAGTNIKGAYALSTSEPRVLICHVKRTSVNQYGGLTDSALANTRYISTGHYQKIDSTVLSQIYNGSRYIFNEVEIYGGDSFIGLFDMNYLLRNEDTSDAYCHSFIVPLESRVNIELREGNHISKNKTKSISNATGLNRETGAHLWEDFNYNDGYSTDNAGDYYIALPTNFRNQVNYDTRIRYSNSKTNGELIDSFRKYSALDYIDVETSFGEIINIKSKFNKIIYWQVDGIGYIPISERALSSSQLGEVVQLGVAGIFERYDTIIDKIGNSNHFGLIESPVGFHWYDAKRKLFVTMNEGMQLSQDSIIKGLDTFFSSTVPDNMYSYDTPMLYRGITGGYDPDTKMVYVMFHFPSGSKRTIGLDIKTNKFIGFFNFSAQTFFNQKNFMFSTYNNRFIEQYGVGTIGRFNETYYPSYFSIIVKDNSSIAKLFDHFEFIGSETTFSRLTFQTSSQ